MNEIKKGYVELKPISEEYLPKLWESMYGVENSPFKKWDAPYFPIEKMDYDTYRMRMMKRIESGADTQWVIMANGKLIGMVSY